ncbi:MAG: histidine phosphatase family protein [Desulfobacteraceae bacterium]|jgi:probable phosphoglycerate mutase|nr:histidine phosphatase family protein [Desulfobacteraceae bacterium]
MADTIRQTTLMAVRHGETTWNIQDRVQGHGDSPLTETGRQQIRELARRLRDVDFDTLISSDLGRARQSAALIVEATGHAVHTDARLRERNFGILEGMTLAEVEQHHPGLLKQWMTNDPDFAIPGGESHREHYRRNAAFFDDCLASRSGTTIVVVLHGGVLDSLFRYVADIPLSRPRCFVTTNASLSVVTHGVFYGTARWVIRSWGDVAHLDGVGYYPGLG